MIVYLVFTSNFDTKRSEVDHGYFKEADAQRRAVELNNLYMMTNTPKVAVVIQRYIH